MIWAHRGNSGDSSTAGTVGRFYENTESSVLDCIKKGFGVEIDVWVKKGKLYLGHDEDYLKEVDSDFLITYSTWLLIHCKNKKAVKFFRNWNFSITEDQTFHIFTHDQDTFAFTSEGYMICYGTKPPKLKNPSTCIIMLPERFSIEVPKGYSVCTDYPEKYSV